jgi:hypothetical protein
MPDTAVSTGPSTSPEPARAHEASGKNSIALAVVAALGGWGTALITNLDKVPGFRSPPAHGDTAAQPAPGAAAAVPPAPTSQSLFVVGRIEDADGKPMEGVSVQVIEVRLDGTSKQIGAHKTTDAGGFHFPVSIPIDSQVRIQTEQAGYRSQTVIFEKNGVTIPATLQKLAGRR